MKNELAFTQRSLRQGKQAESSLRLRVDLKQLTLRSDCTGFIKKKARRAERSLDADSWSEVSAKGGFVFVEEPRTWKNKPRQPCKLWPRLTLTIFPFWNSFLNNLALLTARLSIGVFVCLPSTVFSQVYLTRDEALKIYFPAPKSIERKTLFLTNDQERTIQESAKSKVDSRLVTYYVAKGPTGVEAYAFIDTRIVRTMPVTYLVVINPDSSVRAVEVLAFYEPEDYLPTKRWLAQFNTKKELNDLWLKRGVQNIIGATLSAQAISEGVRRIVATFRIAVQKE